VRPRTSRCAGAARPSGGAGFDATDAQPRVDEVACDRRERPRVREQAEVSARFDNVGPAAHSVEGRRYDRVVLPENRELLRRVRAGEVRCPERHEASYDVRADGLREVSCDEAAEAVRDDVDLRRSGLATHARHVLAEARRQPLVVEPRTVAEAREPADALASEMTAEGHEVRRVAENTVHENARDRMAVLVVERVGCARSPGQAADDPDESGELAPEDS